MTPGTALLASGTRVADYFYNDDFPNLRLPLYAKNEMGDLPAAENRESATSTKEIVTQWSGKRRAKTAGMATTLARVNARPAITGIRKDDEGNCAVARTERRP